LDAGRGAEAPLFHGAACVGFEACGATEVAPFPFVVASADSRFLTGLSARFGMTIFEASGGAAFEAAPFQSHI